MKKEKLRMKNQIERRINLHLGDGDENGDGWSLRVNLNNSGLCAALPCLRRQAKTKNPQVFRLSFDFSFFILISLFNMVNFS